MKFCIVSALLVLVTPVLAQQVAKPDDQARFLAGMSVTGTPLESLSQDASWIHHAKESESAWNDMESRQLQKIRSWSQQQIGEAVAEKGTLFYMFSGPDMLHAQAFFPNASTTILCGLEPVGSLPDVAALPPSALGSALSNLRSSINSVLSFSFFRTIAMKVDFQATQLTGTLPVIYIFLARTGCQIQSAELISLNDAGEITTEKGFTRGAKIVFTRNSGPKQTAYYFTTDVSNDGIRKNKGFVRFCATFGKGVGFTKAASYLMHNAYFSDIRDFYLANCSIIVQDDSGIPVKFFAPDQWLLRYFGNYVGPIDMFKDRYQSDITAEMRGNRPALPFSFGYRWHPKESTLIVASAIRDIPKARPVAE